MKYDVFISYSRADFKEVNEFVETLKRQIPSLSVWFDITGIESGDEFEEKIISAIDKSSYILFALSDNSINSRWAKDEIMYAKNTDKKVVPILLRDAELKGWFLFKFGRVDCIDSTVPLQVNKLIKNLSKWIGKPVSSKSQEQAAKPQEQPDESAQPQTTKLQEQPAKPAKSQAAKSQEQPAEPAKSQTSKPQVKSVKPANKAYRVGDYYDDQSKQGVVFEVWDGGRHGKIVSLDQAELPWAVDKNYGTFFKPCRPSEVRIGCNSKIDGRDNHRVVEKMDSWSQKYPAFAWCCNKGEDWYLPAIEEMKVLLLNDEIHNAVNRTLSRNKATPLFDKRKSEWYWSSTEEDRICAWRVDMYRVGIYDASKSNNYYVRAVSAF